ncbi:MAG TPA: 5-oxoprolinase subunit PxpB, partial [Thermomicrobiales bacterium]|nr:5-oxoprolinase subunit PxpB [Thermomicrobiales bacterium]
MTDAPSFVPFSESSLLMRVGDRIDVETTRRIAVFADSMLARPIDGVRDFVPSYRSILFIYDLNVTSVGDLRRQATARWRDSSPQESALSTPAVTIPVIYGDSFGDDLSEVAAFHGLSSDEIVERHTAGCYTVGALGFSPGFAYLLGLDPSLATPRRSRPRTRIPGGSVGIGGAQTGTYALPSPGGWNLIGRTPMRLFDPSRENPLALSLGDEVRFQQISPKDAPPFPEYGARTEYLAGEGQIEVLSPGLQTTVQDLGRYGFGRMGFAPNGAADTASLVAANRLVSNPDDAAGLEMTLSGPTIRFHRRTAIALTGANLNALLNGLPLLPGRPQGVMPGDELAVRGVSGPGARGYLAVAGGIDVPVVLGSRSTDLTAGIGGHDGRALRAGDWLPIGTMRRSNGAGPISATVVDPGVPLAVHPGPEADCFPDEAWEAFLSATFILAADSNRMGIRLEGPLLRPAGPADIISEGLVTGSIQVTGEGQPIVMLPGHATIGGYARIATVIDADLDRLGQLRPGDSVR